MPHIGLPELLIVLVIVVLVFGIGKLPEIGSALGKGIRDFKKNVQNDDTAGDAAKPESTTADKPKE